MTKKSQNAKLLCIFMYILSIKNILNIHIIQYVYVSSLFEREGPAKSFAPLLCNIPCKFLHIQIRIIRIYVCILCIKCMYKMYKIHFNV